MSQAVAIEAPKPGIYPDIPPAQYREIPAMNISRLRWAETDLGHLKDCLDGLLESEQTDPQRFGGATHCAILEPERFKSEYLIATRCVATTKAGGVCGNRAQYMSRVPKHWDEFAKQADHVLTQCGYQLRNKSESSASLYYENCRAHVRVSDHDPNEKTAAWMNDVRCHELRLDSPATIVDQFDTIPNVNTNRVAMLNFWYCGVKSHAPHDATEPVDFVSEEEQAHIEGIKKSLAQHSVVGLLRAKGGHEATMIAELDGILCKARADKLILNGNQPTIVDLKKVQVGGGTLDAFSRAIANYGYHQQAALYCDIAKALTGLDFVFMWVTVEGGGGHRVEVYYAADLALDLGRAQYRSYLGGYKTSLKTGVWPTYTMNRPKEISLPQYYLKLHEGMLENSA